MFCPKCGTPSKGKRFCTRCGLEQGLPRYQGVPRQSLAQGQARETSVIANQPMTRKVAPAVSTTPQRHAASAQTAPFEQPRTQAVPVSIPINRQAVSTSTRKISTKPQRKVAWLLAVAVTLLFAGGFGFQQRHQAPAAAQVVVSPAMHLTVTPMPTPTLAPTPAPEERWAIVADQTQQVSAAENALSEPDQQAAVIAAGGQLALELRAGSFFGDGPGADLRFHSATLTPVNYTVFVRNEGTADWQRIDLNRRGFVQGLKEHDMGHHGIQQARQLLIRNESPNELALDAICVLYPDQVISSPSHHHSH